MMEETISTEKPHSFFIDWMKGYSVCAIMFHHWMFFLGQSANVTIDSLLLLINKISGNSIHLFFIASGYSLMLSSSLKKQIWSEWYIRRVKRVLLPYWVVVVVTFLLVSLSHMIFPHFIQQSLSCSSLIHNILLTRNFIHDATYFNLSLWFIPNIIGLYMLFPFLYRLFKRLPPWLFLCGTFVLSIGSIVVFKLLHLYNGNLKSIPLFFIFEFVFGMHVGNFLCKSRIKLSISHSVLLGIAGVVFYIVSFLLDEKTEWGSGLNKPFSACGIFILFFLFAQLLHKKTRIFDTLFASLNGASYYMYLIHFPIFYYYLRPLKQLLPDHFVFRFICFFVTYIVFTILIYWSANLAMTVLQIIKSKWLKHRAGKMVKF